VNVWVRERVCLSICYITRTECALAHGNLMTRECLLVSTLMLCQLKTYVEESFASKSSEMCMRARVCMCTFVL
jgi:hypothetical protein